MVDRPMPLTSINPLAGSADPPRCRSRLGPVSPRPRFWTLDDGAGTGYLPLLSRDNASNIRNLDARVNLAPAIWYHGASGGVNRIGREVCRKEPFKKHRQHIRERLRVRSN